MSDFVILCDVTCDLSEELRKEYDIEFIPGHLKFPDGKEKTANLRWDEYTPEEFYNNLKKSPDEYATSPSNENEVAEIIEKYVLEGKAVITLAISSALSMTYDCQCKARNIVLKKHPDAKIYPIDTLRFTAGFGLIAIQASILRSEGKSIEEVVNWIENNKNCYHQAGWLDDLSFVAKKGRISHAASFFGTLAGIKPLGEFSKEGKTTVLFKAKGEKQAYKVLLDYIENTIVDPENQIIMISQTCRGKQAEAYKQMIIDRFHPKKVYMCTVFPSNGINVGPGLMAAYYYGKPISDDLEAEKTVMSSAGTK